jgi:peptidyl-prolyl cis-trans isomerase A (cyclophilin A)
MSFFKLLFVSFLMIVISCDTAHPSDGMYADILTDKGTIVLQLHFKETPITVANFISLAEGTNPRVHDSLHGSAFYDGLPFHRVIADFMIQGGDIQRDGKGNPGYTFEDEFPRDSVGELVFTHDSKGVLSMANSGPNTNGSQFFITHKETPWLDGKHTVFGKVIDGLNVLDSIQQGDEIISVAIIKKGSLAEKFDSEEAIQIARDEKLQKQLLVAKARKNDSIAFSLKMNESKATILRSGLKILFLENGVGKKVVNGDKLKVHYKGFFIDGKPFDSSYKRQKPFEFILGVDRVIEGWTEGISLLKVGGKARLFIPYKLAYGNEGYGPIPEKSKLIFEVEIIESVK